MASIDDTLKTLEAKASEKRNLADKQAEHRRKQKEEKDKVRKAIEIAGKDPNVQILLRYMAKISGQFQSLVVMKTDGDVATNAMLVNSGRRSLYLDIRRLMNDETRKMVEGKGEDNGDID